MPRQKHEPVLQDRERTRYGLLVGRPPVHKIAEISFHPCLYVGIEGAVGMAQGRPDGLRPLYLCPEPGRSFLRRLGLDGSGKQEEDQP